MWTLRITEEQFEKMYGFKAPDIFYREPEDMNDLWSNFMPSKLWRLNNLYTISDKVGNEVRFVMNYAQHVAYSSSLIHSRIIILKSRQQGISTLWLISFFDDAITNDLFECGLMTQGMKESKALFRRIKRLWDRLPDFVKDGLGVKLVKETQEEIGFNNESLMFLQTSFRSGTLHRLHISEFGKIASKFPEKAVETKTGSLQAIKAGNTVVIESTAMGRKNAFYDMWYQAKRFKGSRSGKDFMPVFLSWAADPDCTIDIPQVIDEEAEAYFNRCEAIARSGTDYTLNLPIDFRFTDEQKWWWVSQKRELGDEIGQEYPFNDEEAFAAVRDGAYYARKFRTEVENKHRIISNNKSKCGWYEGKQMSSDDGYDPTSQWTYMPKLGKVGGALYDPKLRVEVAMDLGMNDTMVLVFFQRFGKEVRLIDEYHNSGEGLSHYVNVMKDRGYAYGTIWVPHDAKVRELGTGISRVGRLRELGVRPKVLKKSDVQTGIEQVRKMISNLWIDGDKCKYLIDMFYSYSKEWDDRLDVFKQKPLHDEWSNPADAVRYIAMSKGSGGNYGYNRSDDRPEGNKNKIKSNVVGGLALPG